MRRRVIFWMAISTVWWTADGLWTLLNNRRWAEGEGLPFDLGQAATESLISAWLWIPSTLLALWLATRWPLGRSRPAHVLAHLAGLGATIVGRALAVMALNDWVGWYAAIPPLGRLLGVSLLNNLFVYAFVTLAAHAVHYGRQHRRQSERLARAELQMLRAQMRPHFLFNVLNTIASLISDRPRVAEVMTERLATLLRRSLEHDNAAKIRLADEVEVARAYLEIERARFPDRLSVDWRIDPGVEEVRVPSLLLQPLVENAVRHGLLPRAAPGRLVVAARHTDGELVMEVGDDGVGLPARPQEGIGLSNLRARLTQLYGDRHTFRLESRPGGGTTAVVRLPWSAGRSRAPRRLPGRPAAAAPVEAEPAR